MAITNRFDKFVTNSKISLIFSLILIVVVFANNLFDNQKSITNRHNDLQIAYGVDKFHSGPFLNYVKKHSEIVAPDVKNYEQLLTNESLKNYWKYAIADIQWYSNYGNGIVDFGETYYMHTILSRYVLMTIPIVDMMRHEFQFEQLDNDNKFVSSIQLKRIKKCQQHLNWILDNNNNHSNNIRDQVKIKILDSYGRPESGWTLISPSWSGDYDLCESLRLPLQSNSNKNSINNVKMRYCHARMRHPQWPNSTYFRQIYAQLSGVCIPSSCANYKSTILDENNLKTIDQIIHLVYGDTKPSSLDDNFPPIFSSFYLDSIYCPPASSEQFDELKINFQQNNDLKNIVNDNDDDDDDDELKIKFSTSANVLIIFISFYAILTFFSTLYCLINNNFCRKCLLFNNQQCTNKIDIIQDEITLTNTLCIVHNIREFFTLSKVYNQSVEQQQQQQKVKLFRLDLEFTSALRIFALIMVTAGHYLLFTCSNTNKLRQLNDIVRHFPLVLTNTTPISYVNLFFVLTGLLISYQMLSLDERKLRSPYTWIIFIINRYIRIVPLYALMTWFMGALLRHYGNGPYWDYGTTKTSYAYICENTQWSSVFFAKANFESPFNHCLGVAWYLANDVQFALISPILILLLKRSPRSLYSLTIILALIQTIAYASAIYFEAFNLEPLRNFELSGLAMLMWPNLYPYYTYPWYRISSFLMGLCAGHYLFEHQRKIQNSIEKKSTKPTNDNENKNENDSKDSEDSMEKFKSGWSAKWLIIFIICINSICTFNNMFIGPGDQVWKRLYTSLIYSLISPISSFVYAMTMIGMATGHSNGIRKFLSLAPFKILSRLGLSLLVCHFPILMHVMFTRRHPNSPDILENQLAIVGEIGICVWLTFKYAIPVYILIEAPIVKMLKLLITKRATATAKQSSRQKPVSKSQKYD